MIDASGLVVAPRFIDLHARGKDEEDYGLFALGGTTTAGELEAGTRDVPGICVAGEGKA